MSRGKPVQCSRHSTWCQQFELFFYKHFLNVCTSYDKKKKNTLEHTWRPRSCRSSCLWQTDACACTSIHTNTDPQLCRGLKMEPEPQNIIMSDLLITHSYWNTYFCAIRQTLNIHNESWIIKMLTYVLEAKKGDEKWNECGIPTSYVDKRHTPWCNPKTPTAGNWLQAFWTLFSRSYTKPEL